MTTLECRNLTKSYRVRGVKNKLVAVDDVNFLLESGKTIALVGQSGSGKSTIAKLLLQLERPTSGNILLDGKDVGRKGRALQEYRHTVQMVFQDPFASLNPYHTVAHHLARPLLLHDSAISRKSLKEEIHRLLTRVRLTPTEEFIEKRPHELSGGQRQRVAIARALAPQPKILIADEPVSMLDVSIRLGVLNLLAKLQREDNLGVLYITHDLATARHFSDEIIVLYKGKIVEYGNADDVILHPKHEYTKRLAQAAPNPEVTLARLSEEQ